MLLSVIVRENISISYLLCGCVHVHPQVPIESFPGRLSLHMHHGHEANPACLLDVHQGGRKP